MRSVLAGLRTLVLPSGATTGARIVLNGQTGEIDVYDAANVLRVQISSTGPNANLLQLRGVSANDLVLETGLAGGAQDRFNLTAGGTMAWGGGTNPTDNFLARVAAAWMRFGGRLDLNSFGALTDILFGIGMDVEAADRYRLLADGTLQWGDGTNAMDTNLSRAAAATLNTSGNWQIGGIDQGRGLRQYNALNIAGNTFGAAEAIITTLPSFTFAKGRVYEIRVRANITDATASQVFVLRGRKGTLITGTQFTSSGNQDFGPVVTNGAWDLRMSVGNYTGADIATQWVLTGITSSGTATFANAVDGSSRAHVDIYDVGSTTDRPNEPAIT